MNSKHRIAMGSVRGKMVIGALMCTLFVVLFPVLNFFTHPISVMNGGYEPLLLRLDDLYGKTNLLPIGFVMIPPLLITIAWILEKRRCSRAIAVCLLFVPFVCTVVIQYFIVVQFDKYVLFSKQGFPVPWQIVFQSSLVIGNLCLLAICFVACVLIYLLVIFASGAIKNGTKGASL